MRKKKQVWMELEDVNGRKMRAKVSPDITQEQLQLLFDAMNKISTLYPEEKSGDSAILNAR